LIFAAGLFAMGALGFFVRRNAVVVLLSVELMLNAANLALLAADRAHAGPNRHPDGAVFALFVIVVAAIEAAVGLALVIALYRLRRTVEPEQLSELRG
jgi:NADH-quinone oxidoreductase subunit K